MDSYYALVGIPLGTLIVTSVVSYYCGLKLIGALGLGTFASIVAIIIVHPFHFDNGVLLPEEGNFYTSLYILIGLIIFGILITIAACKDRTRRCCCKRPSVVYDSIGDPIDIEAGYSQTDPIEPYIDTPGPSVESQNIDIPEGYKSSDTESGAHPALKFFKEGGSFTPTYVTEIKRSRRGNKPELVERSKPIGPELGPTGFVGSYISDGTPPRGPEIQPYTDTDDDGDIHESI